MPMKKKEITIMGMWIITCCIVVGFGVSGFKLKKVCNKLDLQIVENQKSVEDQKQELMQLEQDIEDMNSIEYIEKIASEQLGMVKPDTIVIKEKP